MPIRNASITHTVILTLLTVTTLLLGITGIIDFTSYKNLRWTELRERLRVNANQISAGLSLPIWNVDNDQIREIIKSTAENSAILGIIVHFGDQSILLTRNAKWETEFVTKEFPVQGLLSEERPILYSGQQIGSVRIYATAKFIEEEIRNNLISAISFILFLDLSLVLSLYLLLWYNVLKPLQRIEYYAEAMSSDGTAEPSQDKVIGGELGRLHTSIERMVTLIHSRYADLQEDEEKFRVLFESANDAIFLIKNQRFIDCNQKAVIMFRCGDKSQILGQSINIFFPPEQTDGVESQIKAAEKLQGMLNGAEQDFEWKHVRADGTLFDAEVHLHGVELRGERIVQAIIRDISERKNAEEDRRRLITAIEQADECFLITDKEGTIQYINPAFSQVTGYSREEAIGQNPRILKSGKQNDIFYKNLWTTISAGETWKGNFINKKKDGSLFDEAAIISPIRDLQGQIVNYVAVKRDITQEKRMEQQLRHSQKMESIGRLAGGIAHDFNNILSAIYGYSELALEEVQGQPRQYLENTLHAADRARELIKQILTISRQRELQAQPVKMIPLVQEVSKFMRASLPTLIEISLQLNTEDDIIMSDPTQIHQVLMNLCTNAGHAMKQNGGHLKIGLDTVRWNETELSFYPNLRNKNKNFLRLTVSDTGTGISPENLDRIFEPYFSTKEAGEGTGLGLAVANSIVRNYGGDIRVYSEVGRGTVFHVHFPLVDNRVVPDANLPPEIPRGSEHILLVDDESSVLDTVTLMIRHLGYQVTAFRDPNQALKEFPSAAESFDLVITDKNMPGLSGFDLARHIKQVRFDIPILMCTGFMEDEDMQAMETQQIDQVVMKPIRMSEIAGMIRSVLDR